jgi:hypothetical protein
VSYASEATKNRNVFTGAAPTLGSHIICRGGCFGRSAWGDLDHERAEAVRREADELNALASEAIRQSWELVSQAFKVGH